MAGIQIDFDKITEKGLQPIIKQFKKLGVEVESVAANNQPKRDLGFQVKTADLVLKDGQKLTIKVKAGGGIAQAKLNNKVLAIKNVDNLDKALVEVVDYIQANEKQYAKRREALKRIRIPKKAPEVRTSRAEKIEQTQAAVEEITANLESLNAAKESARASLGGKSQTLAGLENDITTEEERRKALETELAALKKAA